MINDVLAWPAFSQRKGALPEEIPYQIGVWGKVPGERSDFRWIARSAEFDPGDPNLAQLSLGTEDQPARSHLWQSRGSCCYAVSLYPSRSLDSSGRTDFIEKQVLVWNRPEGVPAILGALLLLPRAGFSDQLWWDRHEEGRWTDRWMNPSFSLPIPDAEHKPRVVRGEELAAELERGVSELLEAVGVENPEKLVKLYSQVLAGRRPAWLTGLDRPLSPRALAALLLPLPSEHADSLSLASWIPSQRFPIEGLADRWGVLVLPPELEAMAGAQDVPPSEKAQEMVEALKVRDPEWLSFDVPTFTVTEPEAVMPPAESPAEDTTPSSAPDDVLRSKDEIPFPPPPEDASDLLQEIHAFARAIHRRWLDPDWLRERYTSARSEHIPPSWIEALREHRPGFVDDDQWKVKRDLLRSAALLLLPTAETLQAVGEAESGRIPLLFYPLLVGDQDLVQNLGKEALEQARQQLLNCASSPWTRRAQEALERWQAPKSPKKSSRRRG
jgi:hypothetical protein